MTNYIWKENFDSMLDVTLDHLGMSSRTKRCLSQLGIKTIGDLLRKKEDDLLSIRGFGKTSLAELRINLECDIGIISW